MARETLIQMRQGGVTSWASSNPVLAAGEFGVATDINLIKVGDGTTTFNNLGFFANTNYANTFSTNQVITPKTNTVVGLSITAGSNMRYALIASALTSPNGVQITYTYNTNGNGLGAGLIAAGDFVTIVGFSNSSFNYTNATVTAVTLGASPTFTINGSAAPSSSATGTSSTWFYESGTGISDALKVNTTGPGGSVGSLQTNTALRVLGTGMVAINALQVDGTLTLGGTFASDLSFSGTNFGLRLNNATYNSNARITGTATTSTSGTAMLESKAAGTGTYYHQFFSDTSGIIGWIKTVSGTPSLVASSDYRRKENIVPIEDAVEKVKALKPSRFNFKHVPGATIDGFIAHEVAEVIPMAVDGEKDAVDEDGNPIYQGVDASKLIPLLTAALQDALKRIEALEKKAK
jgi:hypothetical protein